MNDDLSNYTLPAITDSYEPFFTRSMRLVLAAVLLAAGIYLGVQFSGRVLPAHHSASPSAPLPAEPIYAAPPVASSRPRRVTDLCRNLPGIQTQVPVALVDDGNSACVALLAPAHLPYIP